MKTKGLPIRLNDNLGPSQPERNGLKRGRHGDLKENNGVMLPDDFAVLDAVAVVFLVTAWASYRPLLTVFARGTLNMQLAVVRRQWIALSPGRENRTFDAVLLGHIINSVSFFGSATLIVLAGLVGALANAVAIHATIALLPFLPTMSLQLFVLRLAVILAILTVSFLSFTYALRKLIYLTALVGGMPEDKTDDDRLDDMIDAGATVLSEAVKSFNLGIRGYYFAIAGLFLFASPWASMAATAGVLALLLYRQAATPTAAAIGRFVAAVGDREQDRPER